MLPPLPMLLTLIAVVTSLCARLWRSAPSRLSDARDDFATVFVGYVSYRTDAIDFVVRALRTAAYPDRLKFGVVEYIGHPAESVADRVPSELRRCVKVHTTAVSRASTLARARALCFDELYEFETLCVFAKQLELAPGWDVHLVRHAGERRVVCPLISNKERAVFPLAAYVDDKLVVTKKPFKVELDEAVPVVVCFDDVLACPPDLVPAVLAYDSVANRSAHLWALKIAMLTPTQLVACKSGAERTQLPRSERNSSEVRRWVDALHAVKCRLGLSNSPMAPEAISKYGTVAACRLAVELHDRQSAQPGASSG